jgi:hypothetical protein
MPRVKAFCPLRRTEWCVRLRRLNRKCESRLSQSSRGCARSWLPDLSSGTFAFPMRIHLLTLCWERFGTRSARANQHEQPISRCLQFSSAAFPRAIEYGGSIRIKVRVKVWRQPPCAAAQARDALAVTLNERKDKSRLHLTKYVVDASERAA